MKGFSYRSTTTKGLMMTKPHTGSQLSVSLLQPCHPLSMFSLSFNPRPFCELPISFLSSSLSLPLSLPSPPSCRRRRYTLLALSCSSPPPSPSRFPPFSLSLSLSASPFPLPFPLAFALAPCLLHKSVFLQPWLHCWHIILNIFRVGRSTYQSGHRKQGNS